MSTEPGKTQGGPGADEPGDGPGADGSGTGRSGGKPAAKPGKKPGAKATKSSTVATASAKPSRDETTVGIGSADGKADAPAAEAEPKAAAEETRVDLASLKDAPASSPEIAPVKDTTEPPSKGKDAEPAGSASEKKGAASSSGPAGWAKPAEPSGSVSTERTQQAAKPFNADAASQPAGAAPQAAGNSSTAGGKATSTKPKRPSFAKTVLKDRTSTSPATTASGKPADGKPADGKPARKAQLQLARLEPWSVMKFSFVMSVVCFVVLLVAVIVLYAILSALGVFDALSDTINSLTREQGETTGAVDAGSWFSFFRIFGYTVLVGALNVLLITALATVGSVIYNLAADLVGGVEVTLKEAE